MIQSIIQLDDEEDRILNIVKAKFGLKNKSQAISLVAKIYADSFLEPELRPEFLEKIHKIKQQTGIRFSDVDELRQHIENA
ncbi:MAG: DUF2683 family protein [Nanoarchaeota archaeon]|nr:DUF2683 family protein [Nanoarchaeota archaeon]